MGGEQLVLVFALVLIAMLCLVSHLQPASPLGLLDAGASAAPVSRFSR